MSELSKQNYTVLDETPHVLHFSYYEYKYLVHHEILHTVRNILEELFGGSDPFPEGIVDSIYYDTLTELFFSECINGDSHKIKFRIRGYGDDQFNQVHQKIKDLSGVRKHKSRLIPIQGKMGCAPDWDRLQPKDPLDPHFHIIQHYAAVSGPLWPSIRVRYHRYRYRSYDYRITLDTNIEALALANGLPRRLSSAILPWHVLEIKTKQTRPKLPFIGMVKLAQVSFSKFMLGLQMLNNENRS